MPILPCSHAPIARALALVAAGMLALWSMAGGARAQGSDRYLEPNFDKKLFVREALLLETQEVATTVSALAALAANFPTVPAVDNRLRAKALAIALRLDGTHPAAVATNSQLVKGATPSPVADFDTLADVARQLWTTAGFLDSPEMEVDERVLQFCLADIARAIDPGNLAESNRYPTRLPAASFGGWSTILAGGEPAFVFPGGDPDAPPAVVDPDKPTNPEPVRPRPRDTPGELPLAPANPTRTAQGSAWSLVAREGAEQLAEIRGDLKGGGGTDPLAVIFSDEAGDTGQTLNDHRDTMVAALSELEGGWPQDGGVLVLSVEAANGNDTALLLPGALLADSLVRGRPLDPRTAALGFLAPEGNLIAVDQLVERLQSFKSDAVDTVLVPAENFPDLQDLALLGDLAPFFRHQIILVEDLQQASAAAAGGRSGDFAKSLQDFRPVQDVAKGNDLKEMTSLNVVKGTLDKIVKLNPQHASAKLLLDHGNGTLPQHLTRSGSLAALYRATAPVVSAMQAKGSADRATAAAAAESITKITELLDPGSQRLGAMMAALLKDIGTFAGLADKTTPTAAQLKTGIFAAWDTIRTEYARLKNSDG